MIIKKGSEGKNALEIKGIVEKIGKKLDFITCFEIAGNAANIKFDHEYTPEVDAAWILDLSNNLKMKHLNFITDNVDELSKEDFTKLPLVGFEIEASDVTSKGQLCNAANLFVQHYHFGFLIVDENVGSKDLYRRAAKILRTFRYQYGHKDYFPLSKGQLKLLLNQKWSQLPYVMRKSTKLPSNKGTGGETKSTANIREKLTELGQKAGFEVYTDWVPTDLENEYTIRSQIIGEINKPSLFSKRFLGNKVTWTPDSGKQIKQWNKFFIQPKLDVVWCIRLPKTFSQFMNRVTELDEDFKTNLPLLRNPEDPFPVIAFEIESASGKHAGGGVLNLSRYSQFGFVVVLKNTKERYVER